MTDDELAAALTDVFELEAQAMPNDAARRIATIDYHPRVGLPRSVAALAVAAVVAALAWCVAAVGQTPHPHGAPAGVLPTPSRTTTSAPPTPPPTCATVPNPPEASHAGPGRVSVTGDDGTTVSYEIPAGAPNGPGVIVCQFSLPAAGPQSTNTEPGSGN